MYGWEFKLLKATYCYGSLGLEQAPRARQLLQLGSFHSLWATKYFDVKALLRTDCTGERSAFYWANEAPAPHLKN